MRKGAECAASLTNQQCQYNKTSSRTGVQRSVRFPWKMCLSFARPKICAEETLTGFPRESRQWHGTAVCTISAVAHLASHFSAVGVYKRCSMESMQAVSLWTQQRVCCLFPCACAVARALVCVFTSYPLRSSLSSAATLRNSASISNSSCKKIKHTNNKKRGLIQAHREELLCTQVALLTSNGCRPVSRGMETK